MNIVKFPLPNRTDVLTMLRLFADDLEDGEFGKALGVFLILETETGIDTFGWGDAADPFRNVGLLEAAKLTQLDGAVE